jgi:UPF0755 protein
VKRTISRAIFLISEIVLIIILSLAYYFAHPIQTPKQLKVERGSIKKIITNLRLRYDLPLSELDAYALRFIGTPQSGWIDLGTTSMSRADFLHKLTTAKAALVPITLTPGETTYLFLKSVSKSYNIPFEEVEKIYASLAPYPEGVLFPDTYHVPKGISVDDLLEYLVRTSLSRHKRLSEKLYGNYNEKLWFTRTVTIASIVQKEAADEEEMPLVASVIYNRLKRGMPLQMDGTLNYGKYSHLKVTPKRIKEDKSAFNTYLNKGLPPYPVCMVSLKAIKAAVAPAKTPYLYFVKGVNGKHIFSKSYGAHLRNIKDVKKRNRKRKSSNSVGSLSKDKRK